MPDVETETDAPTWVVIDVGCHECGVRSEPVGIYATEEQAQAAADARDAFTGCWRDGGQTFCHVFNMTTPTNPEAASDA